MSMLAGPRRKQKVINLRAKNNAWSNDTNKFGQRMLEKMGWSSGKGLGAKENGIVEHVVARYKNDEKGLGFEERNDQWIKHEDDFNALLANLSKADNTSDNLHSGISLEKKSKKSKARIHYHKFMRGKDLSRYSDKDLANIFGKKSFKVTEIEESVKEDVKTTEQVFTDKGNMDDYFKNKLAVLKSKFLSTKNSSDQEGYIVNNDYQEFGSSIETEIETNKTEFLYQSFSFNSNKHVSNDCDNFDSSATINMLSKSKKKKSKDKNKMGINTEIECDMNDEKFIPDTKGDTDIDTEFTKKKKSKKKSFEKKLENETCTEENMKKKKKSKKGDFEVIQEQNTSIEDCVPKKKKKRKQ